MKTRKSKVFFYKSPFYTGSDVLPQEPLSVLVEQALAQTPDANDRTMPTGEEGAFRVLSNKRMLGKLIACNLLDFTMGSHQLVVALEQGVPEYKLEELAPLSDVKQFLKGMLFFGIYNDHVILSQTMESRQGHLEQYLTWLLAERTSVLPHGTSVALLDRRVGKDVHDEIHGASEFTIWMPLSVTQAISEPDPNATESKRTLLDAVKRFVPQKQDVLSRLVAREAVTSEPLEVQMVVRRVGRRRDIGPSLMDEMVHLLRNEEDIPFSVEVPTIGRLTGRQLRLSASKSVVHINGTPTLEGVADAMLRWLMELSAANEIAF